MEICLTSEGSDLGSMIDPRFGRCKYFIFIANDGNSFEAIENPNLNASGGAGIQSAQFIVGKGVKTLLTGQVGPNAHQVLSSAKVVIHTGVSGSVKEAFNDYKNNKYNPVDAATVGSKLGSQMRQL